jgi:hypothetical protein
MSHSQRRALRNAILTLVLLCPSYSFEVLRPLSSELAERTANEGLGLCSIQNNSMLVVGFDRSRTLTSMFGPNLLLARLTADGRHVLGYTLETHGKSGLTPNHISLLDTHGNLITVLGRELRNVVEMAASASLKHVAFWGEDRVTRASGLFWGTFGSEEVSLVLSTPTQQGVLPESSISWGADETKLAFSQSGRIYIYDLSSHRIKEVARGDDPAWSPNGEWLAFRGVDGRPKRLSVASLQTVAFKFDHPISSHIQWSPDSRYVLVAESLKAVSSHCYLNRHLVVYRVSDGASSDVYELCEKKDLLFAWFIDRTLLIGPKGGH